MWDDDDADDDKQTKERTNELVIASWQTQQAIALEIKASGDHHSDN